MQKKHLLLAFSLLAGTFLGASDCPLPATWIAPESGCNVPAPDNFHVEAIGTTWINLGWDFQPDALGGYRIETYRTSDNALINTTYAAWDQILATVDGLVSGEEYRCEINSRCEDFSNSTLKKGTGPIRTIIGELIVAGIQGEYSPQVVCTIDHAGSVSQVPLSAGTYCELSPYLVPTPLRISNQTESLDFIITAGTGNKFTCGVAACGANAYGLQILGNANGTGTCPNLNTDYLTILKNNTIVAILYVNSTTTGPRNLICTGLNGYTIKKYAQILPVRGDLASIEGHSATAAPNPFSNTLEVNLAQPAAEQVQLQLFNLSGQVLVEQQFEARNQTQFSLPTSGLPTGLYFLRIEADGEVQTLKVVKSE